MKISPTPEIIDDIRLGRMVVLVDEEDRENEGDLVIAADFVTPEAINFMITHARGLVCLTLSKIPSTGNIRRSPSLSSSAWLNPRSNRRARLTGTGATSSHPKCSIRSEHSATRSDIQPARLVTREYFSLRTACAARPS